ncbi:MAG: DUF342 domain-containing protein [candidate division Zixibacteria bacterium]|nr:DUF342 domain-containing protein [candidate division Zixibacteria bacterium]
MEQTAQKESAPFVAEKNGYKFTVVFSNDKMVAHILIEEKNKESVWNLDSQDIKEIIKQAGVIFGINDEQLEKLETEPIFNRKIEIARGRKPGKGIDSGFELLFSTTGSNAPVTGDDGYIDYKNLNLINNAIEGQPLAKKTPARTGEPGMNTTGQEILGNMGKERALPKGNNTIVSEENPDLLIADKNGSITFSNNLVSIDNVHKINSDIDNSTGNIDFVGSLQISGDIKSGFVAKAQGNVEVGKNIEDAEVHSNGSVMAKGGFVGSGKGIIKAAEDVFIKYVENQVIEAGNDVNIGGEAMNANIVAGNSVILKGHKAVIVGGSVSAGKLVETTTLGSEFGTPTLVRAGYSLNLVNELKTLNKEITRLKNDAEKIKSAMYGLVRLEIDNKLSDKQKEALMLLKTQQIEIPKECKILENKKIELVEALNENKKASIKVKGTVYPGITVQIGMLKREINMVVNKCTFGVSHDKIAIISHE